MKIFSYLFYSFIFVVVVSVFLFKPKGFIVQSGSMEPEVKVGSLVIVVPQKNYNAGDVITFKKDSKTITHRIMHIKNGEYLTAGDANEEFDFGSVSKTQVMGKVVLDIPYAGYILPANRDPRWFIFLVVVPATIIIYEELKFLFSQIKIKKEFTKPFPSPSILIPVIGAGIVFVSASVAYFGDLEKSSNNILGAADSYGEKTALLYISNEYLCDQGVTNLTAQQAKIAVFKKESGSIKATVKLEGALPSTTYDIWINQDPGGCPLSSPTEVGAIVTDALGNGVGDAIAPEVIGATNFWVSAVGGSQVLRSTEVAL